LRIEIPEGSDGMIESLHVLKDCRKTDLDAIVDELAPALVAALLEQRRRSSRQQCASYLRHRSASHGLRLLMVQPSCSACNLPASVEAAA